jgi:hypothetical protein
MNASKINLVAVLTTTAVLFIASASFAKNNSNNTSSRPKKEVKNFTPTSISTNSIGLSHGNNFISDPGKKKTIHGNTILGTNLGNISHLSGDKDVKFKIKNGSNPPHSPKSFKWHDKFWYCDHSHHIVFVDHFVEPVFANYVVVPGDTFELISLKLFHTSGHTLFLASLNRLPVNTLLIPGQVLVIPAF